MDELEKQTVDELFDYNLKVVAKKFGLISDTLTHFPDNKATLLLNLAEEYSDKPANEDKIFSLLLCAILWENRQDEWTNIGPFICRLLIRIGLGTTAKMVNWDKESNLFYSLGSLISELCSTASLLKHEISINGHAVILSDFQKRMWDSITVNNRIGISAPTSAGKSFVLVNKAIETLLDSEGKVVFIVPTISLIHQVCSDLRKKALEYGLNDIYISQTVNDISLFKSPKIIYVLTQERAFAALNHPDADLENIRLLIVDEIQNIEKVPNENEERAKILLDVIQEFKNDKAPNKIIVSGPRLSNIGELMLHWFGEDGKSVTEDLPSVINVTYSFKRSKGKLEFVQYLPLRFTHKIAIEDKFNLKSKILDKVRFGDDANKFIASLINKNKADGNIVFADTTKNANSIGLAIGESMTKDVDEKVIDGLKEFIAETVHKDYSLIQMIDKGIAFHHAKMPQHIRSIIEKAFSKRKLHTIVSTTTLMQGVNLPAKNIIIRNPKVGNDSLTGYEFTNLKGRAGRLMQDFVGRALIIDENLCNEASIQLDVFQQKELSMGYGQRYEREKEQILNVLQNSNIPVPDMNNDLVAYIRNMCLKYGEQAYGRIKEVGINVPPNILNETIIKLEALTIPKTVCLSNFYWDPILLEEMFVSFQKNEWGSIPTNIVGATNDLLRLLLKMHEFAPYYYKRYLDIIPNEKSINKIWSLCIYAERYGSGSALKDVINPPNYPITKSDDIDERINSIHTKVVYNIPKLLRPIFQINDEVNARKSSQVLSFIEVGAMDLRLRAMIEIGIPRETSIYLLQNNGRSNFVDKDGKIKSKELGDFINCAKTNKYLNPWHRLLIQDI